MTMLSASQLSKSYLPNVVLDAVSLQIHAGERIGLVGPNGAGKTTLLKILAGLDSADSGTVTLARGTALGYLEQGTAAVYSGTMEEELRRAFGSLDEMAAKLRRLEKEMAEASAEPDRLQAALEQYGELEHRFEEAGGYTVEARLRAVTAGLGFTPDDLKKPLSSFSGGERTRLRLARLLLEEPDLLLLDEPTNHLDVSAVEWLESYLNDWRGSVLIVSHDRYFLDRVINRVLALDNARIKSYPGNYSAFVAQRELNAVSEESAYRKQQDYITKEAALIRTSGTGEREKRQAKSRQKKLDKLYILEKPQSEKTITLDFGFSGRSGDIAVRLSNVGKSFNKKTVFSAVDAEIRWGDRVALVGPNGSGKTTLLKLIAGELEPDQGEIWLGPSVRLVYFDQHQQALDRDKNPLEEIMDAGEMTLTEARTYLGRFLFSGEDVFKRNSTLSGGEMSRLALAKLGLDAGNFLVLDEPTNHLDIRSVEELEDALEQFPGTLLVVSHDRYFLSRTTGKVLDVRDGSVRFYKMPYDEYVREREQQAEIRRSGQDWEKQQKQVEEKRRREEELARRRQRRRIEQQVHELEEEISTLEQRLADVEHELSQPAVFDDYRLAREKAAEMDSLKAKLEELYAIWDRTLQDLED
ncbi:MAG: ABC-F family ATP-binding cassette domain-containing protein [Bacillota bacterium]|nr:ABC-F family ATP-binding cassette domain-containing protein [Bacillota bacterium]MDW7684167.1 ABC-F family ATP-binding cassette domain-containing protein [Bacillota bacterium]